MTLRFLLGWGLLAVAIVPVVAAAVRARTRLVPDWSGGPARLAEAVLTLGIVLAVFHLLGAIGLFRVGWVVAGCAATGAGLLVILGNVRAPRLGEWLRAGRDEEPLPAPPAPARWLLVSSVVATILLIAAWASRVGPIWRGGVLDTDSNWYHLPHAARFVQDGWITRLHLTQPEFPSMFHPADDELLHAFGMMLFGSDLLSLAMNFGWLGLALGAAWCVGRPWGVAPLTLIATAVLLATPQMAGLQPASALNDVATVALVLTVAAFLVQPGGFRGATVLAGLAGGIAIGVKLTMLAPIGVLTLGVVLIAGKGRRAGAALAWTIPLALAGGFWYLRNLAHGGSPVPGLRLPWFATPRFKTVDEHGFSVADYLGNGTVWREFLHPGVIAGMGPVWWGIIALSVAGIVLALARGARTQRLIAAAAAGSILAYIVMPTSAIGREDEPVLFFVTVRYAYPGLALGLALLVTSPLVRRPRGVAAVTGALGLVLLITLTYRDDALSSASLMSEKWGLAAAAVAAAVAGCAFLARTRPASRRILVPALAVAAGLVMVGGAAVQHRYADTRYPDAAWARDLHTRIAVVDSLRIYPFYGENHENRVQYVGEPGRHGEFHEISSCPEWRRALRRGRYRYLVMPTSGESRPKRAWTQSDPAAKLVLVPPGQEIYRLEGGSSPANCPSSRSAPAPGGPGIDRGR